MIIKKNKYKTIVGIVDYKSGNINSLRNALHILNYKSLVSSKINKLKNCECIILPGVGSFDKAMNEIEKKNLKKFLKKQIQSNKKIIGICLGMQLLCTISDEGNNFRGFDLFKGPVRKLKRPNIGWRSLIFYKYTKIFKKFNNKFFYFNHQFFFNKKANMIAKVNSLKIPAILIKKNTIGLQFHPEKSHSNGLDLLNYLICTNFNNAN